MSDDQPEQLTRSSHAVWLSVALLLLPLAYVLSLGPAVWLNDRGYLPDWVGVVYGPIDWLYITFPPAKTFFDWYLELFGRSP
jgi:hypothetical protein